ncbi:MAG TPA: hypothetical protein VMA83_04815 [Solirubrobacteraceae bacterium]|nr:hypothetical protein [Solirubrobacteraceae bacterium]
MAPKPPLQHAEARRIISLLQPLSDERRIILVGGQAVAFWERFLEPLYGHADRDDSEWLASKDIDFEGSARSALRAAELVEGESALPKADHSTPNTGLVMYVDRDGVKREIDFIDQPYGLTARDVRNTAVEVNLPPRDDVSEATVWIMHPERCMESRVFNASGLAKTDDLALRQLKSAIRCTRQWSRFLLDSPELTSGEGVRAVLNLNERIFKRCCKHKAFRDVVLDFDIDPFEAVLIEDDRLPDQFLSGRYGQMCAQIADRLKRDRANRARAARRRAT